MDDAWLARLSAALEEAGDRPGVPALDGETVALLLDAARSVAHATERRNAPLACFLLGRSVGHRTAAGAEAGQALADALAVLDGVLADAPGGEG